MSRFVGMLLVIVAIIATLIVLAAGFYLRRRARAARSCFARRGGRRAYGAAIANVLTLVLVGLMVSASLPDGRRAQVVGADPEPDRRRTASGLRHRAGRHPVPPRRRAQDADEGAHRPPSGVALALRPRARCSRSRPSFALFAIVPVGPDGRRSGSFGRRGAARQVALQIATRTSACCTSSRSPRSRSTAPARRLGVEQQARAPRRRPRGVADDQLRGVARPLARRHDDRLPDAPPRGDGRCAQGQLVLGAPPRARAPPPADRLPHLLRGAFAETKRAPFDLPEGESEIVGYFVEYSGMKFGMMFLAEFVEIVVLAGVITAVFLGGWHPLVVLDGLAARRLGRLGRPPSAPARSSSR